MSEALSKPALKILHFLLGNIRFCMEVQYVDKILPLVSLETIPGSPSYLVGLMNLAGISLPVIDLSIRLKLNRDTLYTLDTLILICSDGSHRAGIIVDKILGLESIEQDALQMRSEFDKPTSPFLAVVTIQSELSLLININRLLTISLTSENNELSFDNQLIEIAKYEKV